MMAQATESGLKGRQNIDETVSKEKETRLGIQSSLPENSSLSATALTENSWRPVKILKGSILHPYSAFTLS